MNTLKTLTAAAALMLAAGAAQAQPMAKETAAASLAGNEMIECFQAQLPNTPAPYENPMGFGARNWTQLMVQCAPKVSTWRQACVAARNPFGFCMGKATRLSQLVYFGKLRCPADRSRDCWTAPGYTTDVDINGN
jgi:hypothetical protein